MICEDCAVVDTLQKDQAAMASSIIGLRKLRAKVHQIPFLRKNITTILQTLENRWRPSVPLTKAEEAK